MNPAIVNTLALAGGFLSLFGSAELIYHYGEVRAEFTRKYVHIATGVITLLFPVLLHSHWLVLLLCGSFAIMLYASLRYKLLQSINGIDRKSRGSLLYPLVVYLAYLVQDHYDSYLYFYLPILILAISDPLAALTGKRWPKWPYQVGADTKTMMGSLAFFGSAFLISFMLLITFGGMTVGVGLLIASVIALMTAIAEGLSQNGYDNLSIPVVATLILIVVDMIL